PPFRESSHHPRGDDPKIPRPAGPAPPPADPPEVHLQVCEMNPHPRPVRATKASAHPLQVRRCHVPGTRVERHEPTPLGGSIASVESPPDSRSLHKALAAAIASVAGFSCFSGSSIRCSRSITASTWWRSNRNGGRNRSTFPCTTF